jgi:transcriptional regulator with XRE-family HTH domain
VLRIALGVQLRRLREERGISREEAGDAIRGSHAKISRMELARVKVKERDLIDLLTRYGITNTEEREQLLALARQANSPGWWHQYHDVLPDWFETYLGLEQAAAVIRTYEAQFIPGLLQIPDYARAVVLLAHGDEPQEDIDRRVALRTRRQDILSQSEPPSFWAVIDEAALRRPYGGAEVMRAQLRHLIEISELPQVTIQVVRYDIGGHAAAGGPFTILRFPQDDLPDIVYLEQLTSALYLDKRRDLDQYLRVMNKLTVQAAQPGDTPGFLEELLHQQ